MAASYLALVLSLLPSGEPLRFDWDGEPLPPGAIARLGSFRGREPEGRHHLAAYCSTRDLLATAGNDSLIRFCDGSTGKRLPGRVIDDAAVHALAFSPDGNTLAVAGSTQIVLLDLRTGGKPRWLKDRTSAISGLLFSPDGRWLAALESREGVRIWQTATGKEWAYWKTPARKLFQAAFSGDGRILAVLTSGDTEAEKCEIRFWEVGSGLEEKPVLVDRDARDFVLCSDGRRLVVLCDLHSLKLFDRLQHSRSTRMPSPVGFSEGRLTLSADGRSLALGTCDRIQLHNLKTGKTITSQRQDFSGRDSWSRPPLLAFSPEDQSLRIWQGGDRLRIWNASGKEILPYRGHQQPIRSLRLAADGGHLLSEDTQDGIWSWDCATFQEKIQRSPPPTHKKTSEELPLPDLRNPRVTATAVSSDGKRCAVAYASSTADEETSWLEIQDRIRDQRLPAPWAPTTTIRALAFSPDGRSLAIAGDEGVGLWELATGRLRRTFTGHVGPVNAVLFSPDGRRLFTGGDDWTVLVWDVLPSVANSPVKPVDLWRDLASEDPALAFRAMSCLIHQPRQALPLLRGQIAALKPAGSSLPAAQLIDRLSSDRFDEREQAGKALLQLGSRVRKDIVAALQKTPALDLERQLQDLLADIDSNHWTPDELRLLRAVEVLEHLGVPEARQPLRTLATGVASERISEAARAALARLERRGGDSTASVSTR